MGLVTSIQSLKPKRTVKNIFYRVPNNYLHILKILLVATFQSVSFMHSILSVCMYYIEYSWIRTNDGRSLLSRTAFLCKRRQGPRRQQKAKIQQTKIAVTKI